MDRGALNSHFFMQIRPKISVVIPAHNEEHVIAATLKAVLAQKYPDFEVIVVDNASTDRTSAIVSQFPVKLVHESKKGLLHAREAGRRAATGEIIVNIDADCLPEPDWLTTGEKLFEKSSIVAVTGPYDYHDGKPSFRKVSLIMQKYVYIPVNSFLQLPFVRAGAILTGGNNFIRADVLDKVGGYNTDLTFYGEDSDTAKRVSFHGKVIFSPKIVMKTSARRFIKEGTAQIAAKYWFHFFKVVFGGSKKYRNHSIKH